MTDDAYNYGDKVVIPTEFALNDLHDLAEYSGYCYFDQITEVVELYNKIVIPIYEDENYSNTVAIALFCRCSNENRLCEK